MTSDCPSPSELRRLCDGEFSASVESELCAHIDGCPDCQNLLEQLSSADDIASALRQGDSEHDSDELRRRLAQLKHEHLSRDGLGGEATLVDMRPWLDSNEGSGGFGRIAEFELNRCIGRGGMGVVFPSARSQAQSRCCSKDDGAGLARRRKGRRTFFARSSRRRSDQSSQRGHDSCGRPSPRTPLISSWS